MDLFVVDYVVLFVVLASAALSLIRGFTKEILSIIGWVVAAYAAIYFGPLLKPFLVDYVNVPWVVNAAAMALGFIGVLVVFSFASGYAAKLITMGPVGLLDRTLGIIFGAFRGGLIACLSYFVFVLAIPEDDHPSWMADAKTRPLLQTSTKVMANLVPLDRLPLNISKIEGFLSENPAASKALQNIGTDMLTGDENSPDTKANEKQDSAPDRGYKQTERNSMERLIRNTEGLE
jgi:membrane protein required for colicin V production